MAGETPKRAPLLLVDSDVAFRDAVSAALGRFSVGVEWRARIHGLFEAIETLDPVAVVLSADLPGGDAIDVLRSIRARDAWASLPVILVRAGPSRGASLEAFAEGADAVLDRSRAVAEIAARVLGALPRHRRARRSRARAAADRILDMCELSKTLEAPAPDATTPGADDGIERRSEAPAPAPAPPGPATAPTPPPPPPAAPMPFALAPVAAADPAETPPSGVRPATPVAVPDVVLVEDDPSLLEMLRYALSNRGYQTLSFSNGLDALRALREMDTAGQRPVVLLDVDLPGIDGFRVLHELSGSRPGDYQVVLCTIHNSEATQVLGIQSGALDYLVKPLRMPIVLAKVERLIGRGSFNNVAHG